jgi:hypothetical protein
LRVSERRSSRSTATGRSGQKLLREKHEGKPINADMFQELLDGVFNEVADEKETALENLL